MVSNEPIVNRQRPSREKIGYTPVSVVALDEGQMPDLHAWYICDCIVASWRKCADNNSVITYAWLEAARHSEL